LARLKSEGLKRFHMWPKEPKEIDLSIQRSEEFELLKEYEVQCQLLVNTAESMSSPIVGGFPVGTNVKILEIGSACSGSRRLKVTNKSCTVCGWVSSAFAGKPSLCKVNKSILDFSSLRSSSSLRSNSAPQRRSFLSSSVSSSLTKLRSRTNLDAQHTKYPQVGEVLEMTSRVVLREAESMSSSKIVTLKDGCQMQILEYGKKNQNRAKVSVQGTSGELIGWVTILGQRMHEQLNLVRPHTY